MGCQNLWAFVLIFFAASSAFSKEALLPKNLNLQCESQSMAYENQTYVISGKAFKNVEGDLVMVTFTQKRADGESGEVILHRSFFKVVEFVPAGIYGSEIRIAGIDYLGRRVEFKLMIGTDASKSMYIQTISQSMPSDEGYSPVYVGATSNVMVCETK